jgi:hypothetical protein
MGLSKKEIEIITLHQGVEEGHREHLTTEELTQCLFIAREFGRPLSFVCQRLVEAKEDMMVRNQ